MENQSLSLKKSNDLNVSQMNDLLDILDEAEAHPEFHGYGLIHGDVFNRRRLVIVIDQQAVGFMTPRFEDGYWRTGAIFVSKKYAGKGTEGTRLKHSLVTSQRDLRGFGLLMKTHSLRKRSNQLDLFLDKKKI